MNHRTRRVKRPSWTNLLLSKLKLLNQEGRIAIFIGAGISAGCGLPGWEKLVQSLAVVEYKGGKAGVRGALANFSAITQSRILKTRLKDDFNKAVADVLYASPYQLSPTLHAIARSNVRRICTFNFDDLIEEALAIQGVDFRSLEPGDPLDADFAGTIVLHPHGFLSASMTAEECARKRIVLSEEDYHALYANPYSWANLVQMSLLLSQSCLFVGVSLTDPNIRRLLDACVALPIAHKHYAIMRSPVVGLTGDARQAGEDLRLAKHAELHSLSVVPIWINSFDEIVTIFHRIRTRNGN
jgi:hypothetical protein